MTIVAEYTIVDGFDRQTVINDVNKHLEQGWRLAGNLSVVPVLIKDKTVFRYTQSFLRDKEIPGAWG